MSFHKLISLTNRARHLMVITAALSGAALAATSSTSLLVNPTSGAPGTVYTLTASVKVGSVVATGGTVLFNEGSRLLGSAQIVKAGTGVGKASIKTASFTTGTHNVTATFVGTPGSSLVAVASTSTAASVSISGLLPSVLTIGSSFDSTYPGTTVRGFGLAVPTGNVTVKNVNSGNIIGTGRLTASQLPANGQAAPLHDFLPAQTPSGEGNLSAEVATVDLNSDGYLDLISVNPAANTLTVSLGDATHPGKFLSVVVYTTGLSQPSAIKVGDFNSDGLPDVAVANRSNDGSGTVSVLLGDAVHPGNLLPATNYTVGIGPIAIVVGDFNGDGALDLATADGVDGTLSVLLGSNITPGIFLPRVVTSGVYTSEFDIKGSAGSLSAGDFNNDGYTDLAVAALNLNGDISPDVLLYDSAHAGHFAAPILLPFVQGTTPPAHITVGDFNRDGFLDVAVTDSNESFIVILNSASHPGQFTGTDYFFRQGNGFIANTDINQDGTLDLLVVQGSNFQIVPGLPASPGQFLQYDPDFNPPPGLAFNNQQLINAISIGDLNGDGLPDVVEATNGGVLVLISDTPAYSPLIGGIASYSGDTTYSPSSLQFNVGSSFTISRNSIAFGSRPVGVTGISTALLTNTTSAPIQIDMLPTQGPNANDFPNYLAPTSKCEGAEPNLYSLAAGSTCLFSIVFDPSMVGLEHADITFLSSAGDVQEISISGPGTPALPAGPLMFSPGVIEFGAHKVGTSSGLGKITVTNQSGSDITVTGVGFTGTNPGDFAVTHNTCGSTILTNRLPCEIDVTFTPTAIGTRSANLTLTLAGGTYQLVPVTGPGY